jgi:hypothetical protein
MLYKIFQSKERLLWFVIFILFYLTNTITRLTHQPSSLRLYRKLLYPNNTTATMLYDVSVSTKSTRGFEKLWRANKFSYPHTVYGRLQRNSGSCFFLTPTDRISGHLYVSQSVVCEMATVQERALCVGWLFGTKSVTQTQRNYRTQFNEQPPSDYAIRLPTAFPRSVHDRKRSGRPGVSDECVETIPASFVRSPTKSTRRASRELLLPRSTIRKVLHNTQFFKTPSGLCGHTVKVK